MWCEQLNYVAKIQHPSLCPKSCTNIYIANYANAWNINAKVARKDNGSDKIQIIYEISI
jgi:hypothetical protein